MKHSFACLALALAACGAGAAPLDDIRRQVEASQFDAAYQTALANPQLIGDVHFDFLYGVAAINVGRIPEGLLALERHLAAVPANDRARLELARGYFLLGEYGRARNEFEFVLRYNPPAGVRANIESFLQQMRERDSVDSRRPSARLYAEVGGGYDNNVNGATFRDQVPFAFGTQTLSGSSRQVADSFTRVALGGQRSYRVTNRLNVFAGADIDHRANIHAQEFNLSNLAGYVGFSNLTPLALWRTTVNVNTLLVGGNRYRDILQAGLEAAFSFGPEWGATAFTQYAEQRFADDEAKRDSRNTTLGANLSYNPPDVRWQPTLGLRLSFSQEDNKARAAGRTDLSKQMPYLRASASITPWAGIRFSAGALAFQQNYGGADSFFANTRKDNAYGVDAAASWAINNQWSLRGEGNWIVTRSNQDLYDSSRKDVVLKLRYQP